MDWAKMGNPERIQARLELATRKWWFFLVFILIQFVPSYASRNFDWAETCWITGEVLTNSLVYGLSIFYPIFKVIPVMLVLCIISLGNRVARAFSLYAGTTYVLFAFLQNIAVTPKYGLAIITINIIMFLLVAIFWFWEAIVQKNNFTPQKTPIWKYWVVPFAAVAFWYPAHPTTLMPDFNPVYILTNFAGLTFCLMTPVYLAVLSLYHPRVNLVTLRVTSLTGLVIGFYNVLTNFILLPNQLWWNGVLHIPLIILSAYALALSFRRRLPESARVNSNDSNLDACTKGPTHTKNNQILGFKFRWSRQGMHTHANNFP